MVVAKFLVFLFPLFLLSSCFLWEKTPEEVKQDFSYEDQKENSISGVYVSTEDQENALYCIFYEDNTYVALWRSKWDAFKDDQDKENEVFEFYRWGSWGYYSVNSADSTISIKNIYNRPYRNAYWSAFEQKYKLDGSDFSGSLLRKIYPLIQNTDDLGIENPSDFYFVEDNLKFIDSCDCKISDSWQKYEPWFWKNEQDYLDWIEKSGGDKDKYHRGKPAKIKSKT